MTLFGDVHSAEIFTKRKTRKDITRRGAGNICYAWKNEGKCDKGSACLFSHSSIPDDNEEEQGENSLGSGCVFFNSETGIKLNSLDNYLFLSLTQTQHFSNQNTLSFPTPSPI